MVLMWKLLQLFDVGRNDNERSRERHRERERDRRHVSTRVLLRFCVMKKFHYFLCKYVFCFSIKNTPKKKTQNKGKKLLNLSEHVSYSRILSKKEILQVNICALDNTPCSCIAPIG